MALTTLLALPNAASAVVVCLCPDGGAALELACDSGGCCGETAAPEVVERSMQVPAAPDECTDIPIPLGLRFREGHHHVVASQTVRVTLAASFSSALPLLELAINLRGDACSPTPVRIMASPAHRTAVLLI